MPKITEVYAVVDESDGIIAIRLGDVWMPFVFAELTPIKLGMAQELATEQGKTFTVARFTERTDLQIIKPKPK